MNNDELLENLRLVVEVLLDEGFTRNGISIQTIEAAIVALPDAAFDIIMRQPRLTIMQDERIFKVTAKAFQAAYRKACAVEGITGLHLHDSRAAVVTRLLDAGYTEPQVMLVTLHDTSRMVRSRYNRLKADDFPRRAA